MSSIGQNYLSCEFIDLLAEQQLFCDHIHICVQGFSDVVLKRMNRRYRLSHVYATLERIQERFSGCGIGADLITGFPGERREELEQAQQLFLDLPFSYLHLFPYSEREGTVAGELNGIVPDAERKRRAARWHALSDVRLGAAIALLQSKLAKTINYYVIY